MTTHSDTYRRTREAWRDLWEGEGILERELSTLDYARARQARSLYLPFLPQGELLLEAGCGVGAQLVELDRLGYSTIGLDYAENALARAHVGIPDARLAAGDVHRLPFRDQTFGGYLSFGVLEHFEFGPGPALAEARRVLRAGGILVIVVPYPNLIWRAVRIRRRLLPRSSRSGPAYYETAYSARRLEEEVRRAGFSVLARHPIGHSYTFWGVGRIFRGPGYYETSVLAERLGVWASRLLPWALCFECMVIARKESPASDGRGSGPTGGSRRPTPIPA